MKFLKSPCCDGLVKEYKYKKTWDGSGDIITYYVCSECNKTCIPYLEVADLHGVEQ